MLPNVILPESASCSVAIVLISVDFIVGGVGIIVILNGGISRIIEVVNGDRYSLTV